MSRFLIVTVLTAFAGAAIAQVPPTPSPAQAPAANVRFGWAEVLRVDPVYAPVPQPAQACPPQVTAHPEHSGGGAAGGPIAGNASSSRKQPAIVSPTECHQVVDQPPQQQIVAYDVEYRYRGDVYMSRLPFDPGERMRVRVSVTPAD